MKILFAGDFSPIGRVDYYFNNNGFNYVLGEVKNLFNETDYTVVNFESCVVTDEASAIKKSGPNLCCNKKGIEALKYIRTDLVCLANNHIKDYGDLGVKTTIDTLYEYKMDFVGAGANLTEASQIFYKQISSYNIAFINVCENEFTIASSDGAGANPLNPIKQYYEIREAKEKADFVFIIVHGGHEYCQLPSIRMRETYRFFIDAGATAVINHHQHCYCSYEIYNGKPIFYGLGNFCFDNHKIHDSTWNYGYFVVINIVESKICFKIIPYEQCNHIPSVHIIDNAESIISEIDRLNQLMFNDVEWKRYLFSFYDKEQLLPGYYPRFKKYCTRIGALFLKPIDFFYWRNCIICQSHHDRLAYELEKKINAL